MYVYINWQTLFQELGFWTPDPTWCVYDLPCQAKLQKLEYNTILRVWNTAWTKDKFQHTHHPSRQKLFYSSGQEGEPR
jgi:hypothetical protein